MLYIAVKSEIRKPPFYKKKHRLNKRKYIHNATNDLMKQQEKVLVNKSFPSKYWQIKSQKFNSIT